MQILVYSIIIEKKERMLIFIDNTLFLLIDELDRRLNINIAIIIKNMPTNVILCNLSISVNSINEGCIFSAMYLLPIAPIIPVMQRLSRASVFNGFIQNEQMAIEKEIIAPKKSLKKISQEFFLLKSIIISYLE